jgi:hypothetical protein
LRGGLEGTLKKRRMNRPKKAGLVFLPIPCVLTALLLNQVERAAPNEQQPEKKSAKEFAQSARPQSDTERRQAFMKGITEALERGSYDELEVQFTRFHLPGEELEDGSRKIWLYFAAFQERTASASSLDDAKTFVQKAENWAKAKSASVAARLALSNALLGEMAEILELARKGALNADDPTVNRELADLIEECRGQIISPPEELRPALDAEPELYNVGVQLLDWIDAGFDQVEAAFKQACRIDPFYVSTYLRVSIWLNGKHARQQGAPTPGAWLTKILKPDRGDPEPVRQKKIITYAQTVGLFPGPSQLDPQDLDWPTLKAGLFQLARTHKGSLDWPSRCLAVAYAFQDAEAAKEALELIQGNYSPAIFANPAAFQDISRWTEEASKEKAKKPEAKANP